jgi:rhodanese-related sulfurtransferase
MLQVSPTELKNWIENNKSFLLVDIREGWERQLFNIGGIHIPMGDLFLKQADIPKNTDVVLYCEKGIRSTIAIQRMETLGFHNLYNLSGGMKAWKETLGSVDQL